jgi:protein tyrosine/serine phosphatase
MEKSMSDGEMMTPSLPMLPMLGVRNGWMVSTLFYRGAQPIYPADWAVLDRHSIRTVISLREPDEYDLEGERTFLGTVGADFHSIPMSDWEPPKLEDIKRVLQVIDGASNPSLVADPVFLHCKRGADRTGIVCACWQLAHGVPMGEILDDLRRGGFLELQMFSSFVAFAMEGK